MYDYEWVRNKTNKEKSIFLNYFFCPVESLQITRYVTEEGLF